MKVYNQNSLNGSLTHSNSYVHISSNGPNRKPVINLTRIELKLWIWTCYEIYNIVFNSKLIREIFTEN